jgi:CYTH domain-containing protein
MNRFDRAKRRLFRLAQVHREVEAHVELEELPPEAKDGSRILQGFIAEVRKGDKPFCDVRIRNQDGQCTLTAKFRPLHQEAEMKISKEMFDALWPDVEKVEKKTRYRIDGWDVDELDDGRIFAEYEFKDGEKKIEVPEHWKRK